MDIGSVDVIPTWRNGTTESKGISQRLDRFYMAEDLLSTVNRYRSSIVSTNISNHMHVVLQFENGNEFKMSL